MSCGCQLVCLRRRRFVCKAFEPEVQSALRCGIVSIARQFFTGYGEPEPIDEYAKADQKGDHAGNKKLEKVAFDESHEE